MSAASYRTSYNSRCSFRGIKQNTISQSCQKLQLRVCYENAFGKHGKERHFIVNDCLGTWSWGEILTIKTLTTTVRNLKAVLEKVILPPKEFVFRLFYSYICYNCHLTVWSRFFQWQAPTFQSPFLTRSPSFQLVTVGILHAEYLLFNVSFQLYHFPCLIPFLVRSLPKKYLRSRSFPELQKNGGGMKEDKMWKWRKNLG